MLKNRILLSVVALLITFTCATNIYAEENNTTESAELKNKIKYDLPYPGILPDNPLYKIKVLRDKLSTFLMSDPKSRIDFYLLQTDKGISATVMLVDANKIDLAMPTALKAENNYTLITQEFYRFKQKPNPEFFQKLKTASQKHQEVLESIINKVPKDKQKTFKDVLYFSKQNLKTVEKFEKKKFFNKQ